MLSRRFSVGCSRSLVAFLSESNPKRCESKDSRSSRLEDISLRDTCPIRGRENLEIDGRASKRNYGISTAASATASELQKVPEAPALPIFGTLLSFLAAGGPKRLHEYVNERHKQLGPIYRERIGPLDMVFVNSPQEYKRIFRLEGPMPGNFLPECWLLYNEMRKCKRGLLFMQGEEWLHFRRILNRIMLLPDPASHLAEPCQKAAEDLAEKWKRYADDKNVIPDLNSQLYNWSIEAMLAALMGSTWEHHKGRFSKETEALARLLHKIFEYSSNLSVMPVRWAVRLSSVGLSSWNDFVRCADTTFGIVRALVPEMTRIGGDGLLRKMMDEGIRDDDLIRIVTDFIIAAGDTTAFSVQWALFLLANNPEIQAKLRENTKELSTKELLREPLLRGVIKETLRLYPIAPFLGRYLPENSVIGGYLLRKGQLLSLSIYSSSREPSNFPRSNEFYPERWLRNEERSYQGVIHPHASLPFSMGARSCIGRKLAETQMALCLAQIIKTFELECLNSDKVDVMLDLITVPSEPIQLKLRQILI